MRNAGDHKGENERKREEKGKQEHKQQNLFLSTYDIFWAHTTFHPQNVY